MAKRRCGLSLLGLAVGCASTVYGSGPLQKELPPVSLEELTDSGCSQWPSESGQLAPGLASSEADVAGGSRAADLSVHLLQAKHGGVHAGGQKATGGLRFLHIPRTGGTSVEMANMLLPAGHQAFASLFHDTVSCLQASMYPGRSLAEIYNITHDLSKPVSYSQLVLTNECYHLISIGANMNQRDVCVEYHYPVRQSTLLQAYHQGGPTFCVVREPSQRFLSALKVVANTVGATIPALNMECTVQAYDAAVAQLISLLAVKPYINSCFFTAQAEFIQGSEPYCHHVLHTETLEEDFNTLMRSYGQHVTLPRLRYGDDWTKACDIGVANLSNSTRQLLYEFYKEDYDLLGYPRPF